MLSEIPVYYVCQARFLQFKNIVDQIENLKKFRNYQYEDWLTISEKDLEQLLEGLQDLYFASSGESVSVSYQEVISQNKVNADIYSLEEHIRFMAQMLRSIYPAVMQHSLLPTGSTESFIASFAYVHDLSRFVFNGPLRYTDYLGEIMHKWLFPNFPSEFMHSIKWVTGEAPVDIERDKFGLILKLTDTYGKVDRHPRNFEAAYQRWLDFQIEAGRFPLPIPSFPNNDIPSVSISAEEYTARDKEILNLGRLALEDLIGITLEQFYDFNLAHFQQEN